MRSIATDGSAWSVSLSVCLSVTTVSPAKTAEPIELPFGMWIRMGPRNHVLDGPRSPTRRGTFREMTWGFSRTPTVCRLPISVWRGGCMHCIGCRFVKFEIDCEEERKIICVSKQNNCCCYDIHSTYTGCIRVRFQNSASYIRSAVDPLSKSQVVPVQRSMEGDNMCLQIKSFRTLDQFCPDIVAENFHIRTLIRSDRESGAVLFVFGHRRCHQLSLCFFNTVCNPHDCRLQKYVVIAKKSYFSY